MKRPLLATLALLALCLPAVAEDSTITVVGTGSVRLIPDQVVWQVTAIDEARKLAEAKKWSDKRVANIVKTIEALGIKKEDIQQNPLQMQKKYSSKDESRRVIGYRVRKVISFRQKSLERFDEVLEKLGSRDTQFEEVDFRFLSSQRAEMEKRVLRDAIDTAQRRASRAAVAAGGSAGKLIEVREVPCEPSGLQEWIDADTGSVILRARVEARFQLRDL